MLLLNSSHAWSRKHILLQKSGTSRNDARMITHRHSSWLYYRIATIAYFRLMKCLILNHGICAKLLSLIGHPRPTLFSALATLSPRPPMADSENPHSPISTSWAYLIIFAIWVTAAVVRKNAAFAVEDVAWIALAPFHAIMVAVAFQPDGSATRLADAHAAFVVAVGRAADRWNVRDQAS